MLKQMIKCTLVGSLLISTWINAATSTLDIEKDGIVGKYFPSASIESRVGVLVLGGAEGGIPEPLAKPIVDAGFPRW